MLLRRLLTAALVAGFATGIISSLLQLWLSVPLILQAETFETLTHNQHSHYSHYSHSAYFANWQRHALTIATNIIAFCGFALILSALISITHPTHPTDKPISSARLTGYGCMWGFAAFVAIILAPSLGLAPELPSMQAANLHVRQLWWTATVIATSGGLWLAFLAPFGKWRYLLALILVIAPHAIGAPHPHNYSSLPAELAASFTARSIAIGLVSWLVLAIIATRILFKTNDSKQH